jgi:drug/metabolite transporter (DMT)-like permease
MLYALAIKHVTALEGILIPVIEPILNPVWVFLVLGEYPGPWAFVGGFIVLSAIVGRSVIMALKANRKVANNEAT